MKVVNILFQEKLSKETNFLKVLTVSDLRISRGIEFQDWIVEYLKALLSWFVRDFGRVKSSRLRELVVHIWNITIVYLISPQLSIPQKIVFVISHIPGDTWPAQTMAFSTQASLKITTNKTAKKKAWTPKPWHFRNKRG